MKYDNLDALLQGLQDGEIEDTELTSLPTFGESDPECTAGIYSWDDSRILFYDGRTPTTSDDRDGEWEICDRFELDA